MNKCKRQVFDFCKKAAVDSHEALKQGHPELYEELKQIARDFKDGEAHPGRGG